MGFPWCLRGKETTCRMQKTQFQSLTQKIPHAAEQLSPCSRAWELQLLSPHITATRAGVPWRHALQREKSPQ